MKISVPMFDLTQEFTFDVAHSLGRHDDRPEYPQKHGHSYLCEVTIRGQRHPIFGWVIDFEHIEQALEHIKKLLDHTDLDEIMEKPTMENITMFIAEELRTTLEFCGIFGPPVEIYEIKLRRPTIGEACTYRPNFGRIVTKAVAEKHQHLHRSAAIPKR